MGSIRKSLLERLGVPADPPPGVERASRRERCKRGLWMAVTTLGPFLLVGWISAQLLALLNWYPSGTMALLVLLPMLVVAVAVSSRLFAWGVERFDLVVPWQFRVEGDRDG